MKAIYKKPGAYPDLVEIDNTLEALQAAVGGYIEALAIDDTACIICNEEGKLRDMPYNLTFRGEYLVGPILVVGVSGEDFCDLEDIGHRMDQLGQSMTWEGPR